MSQSFEVNGKKYLPSNELAVAFGYTSDYIGKLAREEKIIGTQVGRQWFIEPESLNTFLQKTKIEKEIRKSELSAKRKIEHAIHRSNESLETVVVPSAVPAMLQAVAVLVCGLFVGGLGWLLSFEHIGSAELAIGFAAIESSLSKQIVPHNFDVASVTNLAQTFVEATQNGDTKQAQVSGAYPDVLPHSTTLQQTTTEIFATLPLNAWLHDASSITVAAASSTEKSTLTKTAIPKIANNFSDEVKVVVGEHGEELIAPVFKNQSSSTQLFRLVPVTDSKK